MDVSKIEYECLNGAYNDFANLLRMDAVPNEYLTNNGLIFNSLI